MIFVDANYIVRFLAEPVTEADRVMEADASVLFERVERGEVEITTSEAVLAEVAFILSAPRHFGLSAAEVSTRLRALIQSPGLRLPQKRLYLRALDVYATTPRIGFVDALTVAYVEHHGLELPSFDRHFDRFPALRRVQRSSADGHGS